MLQSFISEGQWKLPKDERTFSGTLEYNPSGGGYLKLMDLIKEITEVGKTVDKRDIILGITIDGKNLTLCNCIETKTSFANGVFSSTYWIQMIIVGLQLNTREEIKFQSVKARISFIDQWINTSGIEQRRIANNYEVSIKSLEPIKCSISSELQFEFTPTYNIHTERITDENKPLDLSVSQYFDVKLIYAGAEPFEKYLMILNKLINLFSFSIGLPVFFLSIKATHNSYFYKHENENKFLELDLFPALSENTEIFQTPSIAPIDNLIPFKIIENDLEKYFKKWFEIEQNFESVVQLFSGVMRDRNLNLYRTFSSLVQSLEVYHRTKYPEKVQFEKTDFENLKKSIEDFVPDKYKQWISRALEFSNELFLRARIEDLIKTNSVVAKFFKNKDEVDSFIFKVTQTRHYTTHYNPQLKEQAVRGPKLYEINQKLDLFMRIYFLFELGFEEEQIESFLKNIMRYKEMFSK